MYSKCKRHKKWLVLIAVNTGSLDPSGPEFAGLRCNGEKVAAMRTMIHAVDGNLSRLLTNVAHVLFTTVNLALPQASHTRLYLTLTKHTLFLGGRAGGGGGGGALEV